MPKFVLLLRDAGRFDPNLSPAEMQAIVTRDCPHLDFGSIEIREVQPT